MLLFETGKNLEKAVGEDAARVLMHAFEELSEEQKRELASKADLRETELRLLKEIETVRSEIKATELRLLRWQVGGWIGLAAIMAKGFGWLGF